MILPIEPYLQPLTSDQRIKLEAYVEQFCQQDDAHLLFAAHAAFPAVLTADLLYKLWANFRSDELDTQLEWPTPLVSDLLLSPLCQSIGRHIFEIPSSIRSVLQGYLNAHPLYGAKRLDRLAHFLKFYLQENPHKIPSPAFLQAQEFIYQLRLEPQKALESVVESWNKSTHISEVQHLIDQVEMLDNLRATQEDSSPNEKSKTRLSATTKLFKSIQEYQRGQPGKALAWFENFQGQIQEQASKSGIKVKLDHHLIDALPKDLVVKDDRPVFLGVFMDLDYSMHGIEEEKNAIQEIFKSIEGINVVLLSNPSKEYFYYNLNRFKDNICIFHYAGILGNGFYKGDPSETPHDELANLLKTIPKLRFIFLNDGDSSNCVKSLLNSGVNAAILASKTGSISDDDAVFFAINFYQTMVKNSTMETSYKYAISVLEKRLSKISKTQELR